MGGFENLLISSPGAPREQHRHRPARSSPDSGYGYLPGRDDDVTLDTGRRHTATACFVSTYICFYNCQFSV